MKRATCTVTLAGIEFEIEQINRRKSKAWRDTYLAPMTGLAEGLRGLAGVDFADVENGKLMQLVGGMGGDALDTVLNIMDYDAMFDALCEYSPEIAESRELLDDSEDLYDSDIASAFWSLVQLVSPFGTVVKYGQRFVNLLRSKEADESAATKEDQPEVSKS